MRILVDVKNQSSVLADWHGAKAEVRIFDLTFRRLALLLRKAGASDILYVVGTTCRHITGPFRWDNAKLSIALTDIAKSDVTGEPLTRLFDQDAGFELLCHGVAVVRGNHGDIVHSFGEEFLSDTPQEH